MKRNVIFRIFPFNRLSYPVLLNGWERHQLDKEFNIVISDKLIQPRKNDVIIYSFMTPFLPQIDEEIQQFDQSQVLIAGGGPHISGTDEETFLFELGFDILFRGPGEESFIQFGRDILDGKIKKKQSQVYSKGAAMNDFLPVSRYMATLPPLEIIRGCGWRCQYCQTNLQEPQSRSLKSVQTYFEEAKSRGHQRINFISPSAFEYKPPDGLDHPLGNIDKLLNMAQANQFKYIEYGIFPSEIRPESISEKGLSILKKYVSNRMITVGAQSGDPNRLLQLKRAHTLSDIKNAVHLINQFELMANLDFIIAYPDEDRAERKRTFAFIEYLNRQYRVKIQFHHFFPLSGSHMQFRFPSRLDNQSRLDLQNIFLNGIGRKGWVQNEIDSDRFFSWLRRRSYSQFKKYQ